ncbi:hypothetical protein PILCRDRAFT_15272 [Piloderma croceum F 1598]|uniref:GST C-terminal domain-containing protein n=1 Tax=Piloderma croceum (strain F 1598) TaxID=765440 RepID=A0A0C3EL85_PILCF|nr:hypothetical protein PILCRDRAFT_15272 [Piloderma croceum F 1598]
MFPHGMMPAFKSTGGFSLVEGAAIARYRGYGGIMIGHICQIDYDYIPAFSLCPRTGIWTPSKFFDNTLLTWLLCQGKFGPYSKELHEIFITKERHTLGTINKHLEGRTYIIGDKITLADLTLASAVAFALPHTLDKEQRSNFSNVIKHFELIAVEPSLEELLGGIKCAEKLTQNEPLK